MTLQKNIKRDPLNVRLFLCGKNCFCNYNDYSAVNEKFANVLNGNSVCVATGMDFPDALAGGVFAAINNAPLFLVNGKENPLKLSNSQKSFLGKKTPQKLYVFGGTGVVSDSHVQTVADACV